MQTVRRAVIDVGTNSVKLLVADVRGTEVSPLLEESHQTRLGAGFYQTRRLLADRITETARTVAVFVARAQELNAAAVRVIATSAARDALNSAELLDAIEHYAHARPHVLSGEEEAEWAFRGATTDPHYASSPILLHETGGGSTQLVLGRGEQRWFTGSFSLGTVRLLEASRPSDPPTAEEWSRAQEAVSSFLASEVQPHLIAPLQEARKKAGPVLLMGAGGTASILGCMEKELIAFNRQSLETAHVSLERLNWHEAQLWQMSLAERRLIPGLPPKRADVILYGALIYRAVAEMFAFPELRITTRGLRFAALME